MLRFSTDSSKRSIKSKIGGELDKVQGKLSKPNENHKDEVYSHSEAQHLESKDENSSG